MGPLQKSHVSACWRGRGSDWVSIEPYLDVPQCPYFDTRIGPPWQIKTEATYQFSLQSYFKSRCGRIFNTWSLCTANSPRISQTHSSAIGTRHPPKNNVCLWSCNGISFVCVPPRESRTTPFSAQDHMRHSYRTLMGAMGFARQWRTSALLGGSPINMMRFVPQKQARRKKKRKEKEKNSRWLNVFEVSSEGWKPCCLAWDDVAHNPAVASRKQLGRMTT